MRHAYKHAGTQDAKRVYSEHTQDTGVRPVARLSTDTPAEKHTPLKPSFIDAHAKTLMVAVPVALILLGAGAAYLYSQNTQNGAQTNTGASASSQEEHVVSDSSSDAEEKTEAADTKQNAATENANEPNQPVELSELKQEIEALTSPYGSAVAVSIIDAASGNYCKINSDKAFVSASMIKLAVLAEYMRAVDNGDISPSHNVSLKNMHVVGGTGAIQSERHARYSNDELARYMIMYSDNTATNALLDQLGMDRVNARASELGCEHTRLNRRLMDLNSGEENWTSADDVANILYKIQTNACGSPDVCEKAREYLSKQTDTDGMAQGITSGVFAHKTGSLRSIRHDGGIVLGKHPYVIAVLCDVGAGNANKLMKAIGQRADAYFSGLD